jgi:hypothetical protein
MTEENASGPTTLAEILGTFEGRRDAFDLHEVAEAVRTLARQNEAAGTAVTDDIRAEWLAFTLMENYQGDEGFTWGTYYGPVGVFHNGKGTRVEIPPVTEITRDFISHWQERARAARHPLLRIRHAAGTRPHAHLGA